MLKFKNPKKELPKYYEIVFAKLGDNQYCFAYYSPTGTWYPDDDADVVFSINVIGWISIKDLNKIQIKED